MPRKLSYAELSTLLAALRLAQQSQADFAFMAHFDDVDPLTPEQIDALCEELNSEDWSEPRAPEPEPVSKKFRVYLERDGGREFWSVDIAAESADEADKLIARHLSKDPGGAELRLEHYSDDEADGQFYLTQAYPTEEVTDA